MRPRGAMAIMLVALASSAGAQAAMDCPDSVTPARMVDYEIGRAHAAWPLAQLKPRCTG